MARYFLSYEDSSDDWDDSSSRVELTFHEEDGATWMKLTDWYLQWLRAMGYVFNEKDVKDFMRDKVREIAEAECNGDCSGC